ncbi:hypothetical protein [Chitinophaga niabensis]|uniref:Uncharacterized protein n=1 Tax=Chitinophaga niabensis TaxID=536979 RepID=A0A1N6EJJ1_9BACT|nr:hypothetical protein [Chitinophaga niabensis]SIN83202.1 hypothetical protein SAMN04488055_1659 [Chitinophaga niabensis]
MYTHNLIHSKLSWYFMLLTGSLLFISCKKEGPMGPPGTNGNANVHSGTVSLTNTDWKWASSWALITSTGTSTFYATRYAEINTELITQEIADKGSVQVFFKPNNEGWVPFPYILLDVTRNYFFNFMYEYMPGKIRLHYFWSSNIAGAGVPTGLNTYPLPNYTFKYVITAAQ